MAKETKTVSMRLDKDVLDLLEERGNSITQDVHALLRRYRDLRTYSLNELRGKFSPAEWKYIADSFNGTLIPDDGIRYSLDAFAAHIEDSNTYDNLAAKWGVDIQALLGKCRSLTHSQLDALYYRVSRFWEGGVDLETWAIY